MDDNQTNFPSTLDEKQVFEIDVLKRKLENEFSVQLLKEFSVDIEVFNEAEAKKALSMALQARRLSSEIEKSRVEIVKPHVDYHRTVNKIIKDFKDNIEQIENNLKGKIDDWIVEEKDNNPFFEFEKMEVEYGSLTSKMKYDFIIEDFDLVPMEYKTINAIAVEKSIKLGLREIPGLKITEKIETSLRIKSKEL